MGSTLQVNYNDDNNSNKNDNFKEYMKRIGVNVVLEVGCWRLEVIQKTALLGTAKILRKVLSL